MNYMNRELFQHHAMEGQTPVLVAFCASWCGYCRRILPALKERPWAFSRILPHYLH